MERGAREESVVSWSRYVENGWQVPSETWLKYHDQMVETRVTCELVPRDSNKHVSMKWFPSTLIPKYFYLGKAALNVVSKILVRYK